MNAIRAVYEHGQLRLLDPVNMPDGQRVEVTLRLMAEDDLLREALSDLDVQWADSTIEDDIDEDALQREIEEGTRGVPPLSEAIIDERREGR